jgi:hypothetical protein
MEAVINLETGEITYFRNSVQISEAEALEILKEYVCSVSFDTPTKSYLVFIKPTN